MHTSHKQVYDTHGSFYSLENLGFPLKIRIFLKKILVKDFTLVTLHFSRAKANYMYHIGAYRTSIIHI